jgi:NAD dependent epimerase/dehydratase family enzyme
LRVALGEMADALLLSSQRVHADRPPAATYAFRYENLEPALHAILTKK